MTTQELIQDIESNKHDITLRLRRVVLDPIKALLLDGVATSEFSLEQGQKSKEILANANSIMDFFSKKWNNPDDSEDNQLEALREGIKKSTEIIIPEIENVIIPFYNLCFENKHYFSMPFEANRAYKRILQSISSVESVINGVRNLEKIKSSETMKLSEYSILELLQEGLDEIDAIVTYNDEYEKSFIKVKIDKDEFLSHVLANIKENIETHAFGTSAFAGKSLTEKKVMIDIVSTHSSLYVTIANNGTPFKGDFKKVFDHGYFHGSKGHTGTGMYSLRKTMQELGGDAEFHYGNHGVTYKLIFT